VQAGDVREHEPGGAPAARQFRGADQAGVLVRAGRQQPHQVLGADDREGKGPQAAVQRRADHVAARPHQLCECSHDRGRIRHVLEQFETGHQVIGAGLYRGEFLGAREPVVDVQSAVLGMQSRDFEGCRREVDAGDAGTAADHAFGQQAATAADVEYAAAGQSGAGLEVVEPRGIHLVQRPELAGRVPPARRGGVETGDFRRIGIACRSHLRRPAGVIGSYCSIAAG
jgi:hypothetical protein